MNLRPRRESATETRPSVGEGGAEEEVELVVLEGLEDLAGGSLRGGDIHTLLSTEVRAAGLGGRGGGCLGGGEAGYAVDHVADGF